MPAPTLITELSQTIGSNGPAGSTSPIEIDNYIRANAGFIAQLRDGVAFTNPVSLASAGTTSIGAVSSLSVEISGTTTITSFGTTYKGPRFLRFTGALILTHSSTLNLPGAANITTVAGDTCIAVPNLAVNGWNVIAYQRNDAPGAPTLTAINGGPLAGFRNIVINGGFTVNQRGYVSTTATAAGTYMHDRWKSGTINSAYTFTQANSDTTITITAGTIIQVIEDKNVQAAAYVLSWAGTATARYAVNSATPAGAYAASPILITGQTAGSVMSIEFSTGTLGKVQLERGTTAGQATSFEQRNYGLELTMCQRYYRPLQGTYAGFADGTAVAEFSFTFSTEMRTAPTLTATATLHTVATAVSGAQNPDSVSLTTIVSLPSGIQFRVNNFIAAPLTAGQGLIGVPSASNYGHISAEY